MNQERLNEILRLHKLWLEDHPEGVRADLRNADLRNADLRNANLRNANLRSADLRSADLFNADLSNSDLSNVDLRRANLINANLINANLMNANLRNADLRSVDLRSVDLANVDLRNADLRNTNLTNAEMWNTVGNGKEIKSLHIFEEYSVNYTKDILQIGCKKYPFSEWWQFSDEEILEMGGKKALNFWKNNKELIKTTIETNPAI